MEKQEKAQQCLTRIEEYFKGNKEIPEVFLAGALSKSKILLEGSHGKGKTFIAELTSKVLGLDLSIVQGSAGLTESKFLARYDVAELMKGNEVVDWKQFVDADLKLFDEINRVHPSILNGIFTMLARNRIDFGDDSRELKPYIFVGTMNPADSGTYVIPLPLYDRFDISILTESVGFTDKLLILKNHKTPIEPVLQKGEIDKLWSEVETVKVPERIYVYLTTITRDLQLCLHGSKEFITNFPACCDNCRFKNYVCSCISNESPISERLYQSIEKVAKGLAYIRGRDEVDQSDIDTVLKYSLYHRLKFVPLYQQQHVTIGKAIDNLISQLNKKERERTGAYALIADIYANPSPAKLDQLNEWTQNDLLLAEIFSSVKAKAEEHKKKLEDGIKSMTVEQLEELQRKIEKGEVQLSKKTTEWVKKKLENSLVLTVSKKIQPIDLKAKIGRVDMKLSKEIRKLDLAVEEVKANGDHFKLEITKEGITLKADNLEQKEVLQKFLKEVEEEVKA